MTGNGYQAENIMVENNAGKLVISAGSVRLEYDLGSGLADIYKLPPAAAEGSGAAASDAASGAAVLSGVFAETGIGDRKVSSAGLSRAGDSVFLEEISDGFGPGVKISVKNAGEDAGIGPFAVWQNFYAYQNRSYVLLETVLESAAGAESNYLAPIAAGSGDPSKAVLAVPPEEDARFLFVPWDNDGFIRYRSDRLIGGSESSEVTAVFDNKSRRGFVTGSVTHDVWKTGIRVKSGSGRNPGLADFRVFGGYTSKITRDTLPHGAVGGHQIKSPKIFFGFYEDWRDGMEEFGGANGVIAPPLAWDKGPPFGWNSWSAVADKINYEVYVQASDFLKKELPGYANGQGVVYVNFDSFWTDNLTPTQIRAAVKHVKDNGQHPGTYSGFYSYWDGENWGRQVERTDGKYTYGQIVLKDHNGKPLPPVDGARPLDPTHPGTIMRAITGIQEILDYGFEYVKLDFMAHGAIEGDFYNKDIKTGIEAYNYGMQKFIEGLGDLVEKQEFFIGLSIAPTFPSQYAHARRVSCDAFGGMDSSEYMLNSLTYGWWLQGPVYKYNDPDHISVYNSFNHKEPTLYNEGLTRYLASAISGGLMVDSDDFRLAPARERTKQILGNAAVNALAAKGKSFRPVEGNTNDRAADQFVLDDGEAVYLAVFNFSTERAKKMAVNLERIGLDPAKTYRMKDMVGGGELAVTGAAEFDLAEAEPKLVMFRE